ncbi:hypothetical protein EPO15_02690 [bacterium]|nr:MAG: hypothetical protein EPO15_02690 [bacterium]
MPRKAHRKPQSEKDPRETLVKEAAELGKAFEAAVNAAVQRPEFSEGIAQLNVSLRGAAEKLAEAVAAASVSEEGEALKKQAEKVAAAGRTAGQASGAAWAKGLSAGLRTLAEELDKFADAAGKKRKKP